MPLKTVDCFHNKKPWIIINSIKGLLNDKERAFEVVGQEKEAQKAQQNLKGRYIR